MSAGAAAAAAAAATATSGASASVSASTSGSGAEPTLAASPTTKTTSQSLELMSRVPDLISKSNLPPLVTPQLAPPPPPPSVTSALGSSSSGNRLPVKKNNHSYINNGFNSSGNSGNSGSLSSGVYRPGAGSLGSGSAPMRRITMVGDDIILEEEELPATPSPTAKSAPLPLPQPQPQPLQLPSAMAKTTKSPIYMNVNSPKRMQPYSDKLPIKDALQQQEQLKQQQQQQQRTSPEAQGRDEVDPVTATKFPNPKD